MCGESVETGEDREGLHMLLIQDYLSESATNLEGADGDEWWWRWWWWWIWHQLAYLRLFGGAMCVCGRVLLVYSDYSCIASGYDSPTYTE